MQDFFIVESCSASLSKISVPRHTRSKRLFTENRIYSFEEIIEALEKKDPRNLSVVLGNQKIPILSTHDYPLLAKLFVVSHESAILSRLEVK